MKIYAQPDIPSGSGVSRRNNKRDDAYQHRTTSPARGKVTSPRADESYSVLRLLAIQYPAST